MYIGKSLKLKSGSEHTDVLWEEYKLLSICISRLLGLGVSRRVLPRFGPQSVDDRPVSAEGKHGDHYFKRRFPGASSPGGQLLPPQRPEFPTRIVL